MNCVGRNRHRIARLANDWLIQDRAAFNDWLVYDGLLSMIELPESYDCTTDDSYGAAAPSETEETTAGLYEAAEYVAPVDPPPEEPPKDTVVE